MEIKDFLIALGELAEGGADKSQPLGFIDLDASSPGPAAVSLPPFPVIGLGDPAHPLAPQLDAVVEPPVTAAMLMQSISARPTTAAVAVCLLRSLETLSIEAALMQESLAYGLLQGSGEHGAWLAGRSQSSKPPLEGHVRVRRDGDALDILLDRPTERNAVDRAMRDALREAFLLAALDPDIRSVTLRGAGKAFCVGADLLEFGTTRDPAAAHLIRMQTLPAHVIARCAEKFEAFIQGACVGAGLEMAAFARRIGAARNAWFQLPELDMGVIPGAGGCVSVSRRIGRQRAALMILSGKRINVETALRWGLVDTIVDDGARDDRATDIVR